MKNFSPKNKIYRVAKTLLVGIVAFSLFSPTVYACVPTPPPSGENCYTITFNGRTVNSGLNTSTWSYTISKKAGCSGAGISYWMWIPCFASDGLSRVLSTSPTASSIGYDGSTGHYGVKWEFSSCENWSTPKTFTITISGQPQVDEDGTTGVIKAGTNHFDINIPGPSCAPEPVCGNEILETGEQCDDGNQNGQVCTPAYGQSCNYCSTACQTMTVQGPYCGDNIKNGTEACDGTDGVPEHFQCTDNCTLEFLPFCGDGIVQPTEECDDGNTQDGDGCSANCQTEVPQLCESGETLTEFKYNSKPQIATIDSNTTNLTNQLCGCSYLSVDTSNGLPHYIYITWDNLGDISNYDEVFKFNLLLNHKEDSTTIKVELKNQLGNWVEVCDPAERSVFIEDTCDLAPYELILKEVDKIELRIVSQRTGTCHEYLKCAKLDVEMHGCEAPEPYCGDGTKNGDEQCDGTDGVPEHYTCTSQCTLEYIPYCGDNIKNQPTEECDGEDGVGEHQACNDQCEIIDLDYCGDQVKNGNEECDGQDGISEHYICTDLCTLQYVPYCGDGIVNQTSEQCDDGNLVNGDGCDSTCQTELPVCDINVELAKNGGFESPLISDSQSWDIFTGSELNGWNAEWVSLTPSEYNGYSRPTNAYLEFQNDSLGWAAQEGEQYAELDSDWDGYGGLLNGEPASTKIYQDIPTIPGETYTISFWFSPRPNTALENNRVGFSWNGSVVADDIEGAGENTTVWTKYTYELVATSNSTRIQFADLGYSDSYGTFLDNISVRCGTYEPQPYCGDGIKNNDEQCDGTDGVSEHYTCTAQCTLEYVPYCGDEIKNGTEQCDGTDGVTEHYTCTGQCTLEYVPYCGDGVKNNDEQCDGTDGVSEHYTCTAQCTLEYNPWCGDSIKNGTEQCDGSDGVTEHYTCNSQCALAYVPYCGDQTCNGSENCSTCSQDCGECGRGGDGGGGGGGGGHLVRCGDGITEWEEQCDDGNLLNGDGCSSVCKTEMVAGETIETEEVGEILSARTELPSTGNNPARFMIIGLILLIGSAIGIRKLSYSHKF